MPISVPPRPTAVGAPEGSRVLSRTARPLNGREVADAVRSHTLELAGSLLKREALKDPQTALLLDYLVEAVGETISRQQRLQKVHLCYPKVGWAVRVRLERLDDAGLEHAIHAECDLDLERNVRILLQFGESGRGPIVSSIEDEKLSTGVPDEMRKRFDMPIEVEFMKPNGDIGKVDIRDLQSKEPKKAARTINVGSGADARKPVQIPSEANETVEVMVAGGQQGETIVLPSELPEISLDDVGGLVAEPPQIEKAPSEAPPPPVGGMGKTSRPNVKFNRR